MSNIDFCTTTHAKCILAGEHAVLRGHPALVMPVDSRQLTLTYKLTDKPLQAHFTGEFGDEVHLLFWSVLERGLSLVQQSLSEITGEFTLSNTIPIGCGLGASAALSSALSNWFCYQKWIEAEERFAFAKRLEDLFHGTSSGVDIVGSMSDTLMYYRIGEPAKPITSTWSPQWYLYYCGHIGKTSICVNKVKALWQQNPTLAERVDTQMHEVVERIIRALNIDKENGLPLLAEAINKARICFTKWDLSAGDLDSGINLLLSSGALAAKPTGSGGGGYILSLWDERPPESLLGKLIPV